jgi:citrate synthase
MNEFKPGLEDVVAFETEIAEPDREGGALRYRGVDIEKLVGRIPFVEHPQLEVRTGSPMHDAQAGLAPAMFACSRTAGWSAHTFEQKRLGKLVRPAAKYVGPGERSLAVV